MSKPEVTVLLPVYNASGYLRDAVDSILRQTFKDFELLVINDGSKDDTSTIIQSYSDPRIRTVQHSKNEGLIKSLNEGLKIAHGNYIVRMDADDVSLPNRISRQVKFMNAHPEVAVAGTWFKDINGKGKVAKTPGKHDALKSYLFFSCGLAHPTVIIRKNVFQSHHLFYNADFPHAEDYELWVRASRMLKLANIPEVLLHYRYHDHQVSSQHNSVQRSSIHRCHQRQLMELGLKPNVKELRMHFAIANLLFKPEKEFAMGAESWLAKVEEANKRTKIFSQASFKRMIGSYWYNICSTLYEQGLDTRKVFTGSTLIKNGCVSPALQLKFRMKYQMGLMKIVQKKRSSK